MKRKIGFLLSFYLLFVSIVWAQKPIKNQANWQQYVSYNLKVELDDNKHMLHGNEVIVYTNNSPDTLREIYMHLWPNAYKNNETAYAKQKLENGKTDFYFAPEEDRGWIDSIHFRINNSDVKWELTSNIDIAKITLAKPIHPGMSVTISTPFVVKIPTVFSRLGHEAQLYCITQWYPKPAVYDVNGWNPMPYLDQGEFYSEFGKFDVSITVPQNYVVAATGVLQNEEEKKWLLARAQTTSHSRDTATPPSSSTIKTLRFVQDSVHDFAWFADKRFKVDMSSVTLQSTGRKITTWFYSVNPKDNGVNYIDTAVLFYSKMLGDYPYSSASVVVTPLVAGAGMEYPMITNITETGRQVIVHEVGHNWLYGILASNEREYPWMDESINNYYETRSAENDELKIRKPIGFNDLNKISGEGYDGLAIRYLLGARKNEDQACFLPSVAYTDYNYGAIIYGKASTGFHYLQRYLGDSLFDAMMQSYYEQWKFKHPLPDDFINHAKRFSGKDLDWFFNGLMSTTYKQDWKVSGLKRTSGGFELAIKNKSPMNAPFSITGIKNNKEIKTIWVDGLAKTKVLFPAGEYDFIRVDALEQTTDIDRSNNSMNTSGLFKKADPLKFRLFLDAEDPYKNQVFFSPIIGANLYNKTMLGVAFYNGLLPNKKTDFIIAPMYAVGTNDLAGSAEFQRHFLSYGFAKRITVGLKTARFASEYYGLETSGPTTYEKVEPSIRFELTKSKPRTDADKHILVRYVLANEQNRTTELYKNFNNAFGYADAEFVVKQKRKLNPYGAKVHYQYGNANSAFQKIDAEVTQFLNYDKPDKGFTIRLFGGVFLQKPGNNSGDDRVYYRATGNTGQFDYLFDQSQFGRGEGSGSTSIFAQQLMPGGAQFSSPIAISSTDSWMTGVNMNTTIPGIIPIKIYADGAFINEKSTEVNGNTGAISSSYKVQFYYTAGIRVSILSDILQVNFPMFASQQITDIWDGKNGATAVSYGNRISFILDLNKLNPVKGARNLSF